MVVVERYFGGIKLGAGGLTRAYGQAAQAVMEILPTEQQIEMDTVSLVCNFSLEQSVRHWVSLFQGEVMAVDYSHQVSIKVAVPKVETESFTQQLEANRCEYKVLIE